MGIQFEIDPTPQQLEQAAIDLLLRILTRAKIDPVAEWPVIRWVILNTPEYRLAEQAENPLWIDADRIALAVEAYRQGVEPGINTHFDGWVEE